MTTVKDIGYGERAYLNSEHRLAKFVGKEIIYIKWSTGGVSGGSCWNQGGKEDPHYPMDAEKEPSFDELDELLIRKIPNMTFLQFRKLERELVHSIEWTDSEYYGNSTDYSAKFVVLEELDAFVKGLAV